MDSLTLLPANKLNHRGDYCLVLDVLAEMMMKYWVEDEFKTQRIFKRHIVRIANHCIRYVRPSIYDLLHCIGSQFTQTWMSETTMLPIKISGAFALKLKLEEVLFVQLLWLLRRPSIRNWDTFKGRLGIINFNTSAKAHAYMLSIVCVGLVRGVDAPASTYRFEQNNTLKWVWTWTQLCLQESMCNCKCAPYQDTLQSTKWRK